MSSLLSLAGNAAPTSFYDFPIEQSLRFNDDDSAYLSRTPASAGNRKTWTWSGWVKRGNIGANLEFFDASVGGSYTSSLRFNTSNLFIFQDFLDANYNLVWASDSVFRDTSSWYSIVFAYDGTQANSSDAATLWVNGVQQTLNFTAYTGSYVQNRDTYINSTTAHNIGRYYGGTGLADGYLADVNFIDGTAYTADSFGQLKSGIWIPKDTSGLTFGTNGFRLQYGDSAAIGDDTSGNTNDWTANNLVASDVVLDSPTDNFCTWNPLKSSGTLADGNLQVSSPNIGGSRSTIAVSSGKWYWEVTISTATIFIEIGVVPTTLSASADVGASGSNMSGYYASTGSKILNGSFTSYGSSFTTGDVIGVALNCDANTIEFYKNNVSQGSFTMATASGTEVQPVVADANSGASVTNTNFGQLGFTYTPPSDYLALSTANLPTGAIDTAADETPEDYFNTVLWTGDGTTDRSITGVGFQPDFIWQKNRSSLSNHNLVDAVRGIDRRLLSWSTIAEVDSAFFSSFDSDGFTLDNANDNDVNASSNAYVSWNWKAGGAGVSNTDGSITSTVSVGATSQQNWFSVVGYVGDNTTGATVGHGLGVTPSMIIVKDRDTSGYNWHVYHEALGNTKDIKLNLTNAAATGSFWNNTSPTSSVFTVNGGGWEVNTSGQNHIAYCFANAEGMCKVGSYVGNGSTDGTFVYTGHRPAFLLIKKSSDTGYWILEDSERNTYNPIDKELFPNDGLAENDSNRYVDFLSNGFKIRHSDGTQNLSGATYIYLSIAEQPFAFANAR